MSSEIPDLRQLINRLDPPARKILENASRFAQKNGHFKVTVGHCLLQMLDDSNSEINQRLQKFDIEPLDWIKSLLSQNKNLKIGNKNNPVFSDQLIGWINLPESDGLAISLSQLFNYLVVDATKYGLDNLPGIKNQSIRFDKTDAITRVHLENDDSTVMLDTTLFSEQSDRVESSDESQDNESRVEIPGYEIIEPVGKGGMASVYRARHLGLDRNVAIKVLTADSMHGDDFAARFLREARIVAKLAHPNVIQIYDISETQDLTFIAMEYVSGGELSAQLEGSMQGSEVVRILSQVLAALQVAHDNDFIHRDIKPANILFRQNASLVLTDFGIARVMSEDTGLTIAGAIVGTPKYMSPEQARGDRLDHRSDLYSVGVLFYQMIEGELPYKGESAMGTAMKHILDPVPEVSPQNISLQSFIDRAMAKDVKDRFQSANEMADALNCLEFGAPVPEVL